MIEVWAAICGASITAAALGFSGFTRQNQQGRESLVRLTTAVDNLTSRLDLVHQDIRQTNQEVFERLRTLESSVARLEGLGKRT